MSITNNILANQNFNKLDAPIVENNQPSHLSSSQVALKAALVALFAIGGPLISVGLLTANPIALGFGITLFAMGSIGLIASVAYVHLKR